MVEWRRKSRRPAGERLFVIEVVVDDDDDQRRTKQRRECSSQGALGSVIACEVVVLLQKMPESLRNPGW